MAPHACMVHTQLPVFHRPECKQNNVLEVPLHNSMSQLPGVPERQTPFYPRDPNLEDVGRGLGIDF